MSSGSEVSMLSDSDTSIVTYLENSEKAETERTYIENGYIQKIDPSTGEKIWVKN